MGYYVSYQLTVMQRHYDLILLGKIERVVPK